MNAKEKSYRKSIWWKSKLKIIFPPSCSIVRASKTSSGCKTCRHLRRPRCQGRCRRAGSKGRLLADWARALLLVLKNAQRMPGGASAVSQNWLQWFQCSGSGTWLWHWAGSSHLRLVTLNKLLHCVCSYLWNWKVKELISLLWEFKGFPSWKCILQCPVPKCSIQLLPWTGSDREPGNRCESRLDFPSSPECTPTHLCVRMWNTNEKGKKVNMLRVFSGQTRI